MILVESTNGSLGSKNSLESARTSADCVGKTVVVTSGLTQDQSNITGPWPATIALRFSPGGSIANSTTFTVNGPLVAGVYQIFKGAGRVDLTNAKVETLYPQSWGAKGDGATDDTSALLEMAASKVKIFVPTGVYPTASQLVLTGPVSGVNSYDSTFKATAVMASVIKVGRGGLADLGIDANSLATAGVSIYDAGSSTVTRLLINNAVKDGIYGGLSGNNNGFKVDTCVIRNNGTAYGTGTASSIAHSQTVTLSGAANLSTLGLRPGVDYIKLTGETDISMIITVDSATQMTVYPAPINTLTSVGYSIKSGAGILIDRQGDNNSWLITNTTLLANNGAAMQDLSVHGAASLKNIIEANYLGIAIGRRGTTEPTYDFTDVGTYYESSTYKDIYFDYAGRPTITNSMITRDRVKIVMATSVNLNIRGQSMDNDIALKPDVFSVTSNTTLGDVPYLTANVFKGGNYVFEATLFTDSGSSGGVKSSIAGTATGYTSFDTLIFDATTSVKGRSGSLGASVGATTVTVAMVQIKGGFQATSDGTLTVQFAQNVSNGTASRVLPYSTFRVKEISP